MSYLEIFYGLTEKEREDVEQTIVHFHEINKPKENRKATLKFLLMLYRHTPPSNTRCTPVIQISNGKEYVWESVSTCCEKLNIKKTTLYHALSGGWKTKGCYWKWGNK